MCDRGWHHLLVAARFEPWWSQRAEGSLPLAGDRRKNDGVRSSRTQGTNASMTFSKVDSGRTCLHTRAFRIHVGFRGVAPGCGLRIALMSGSPLDSPRQFFSPPSFREGNRRHEEGCVSRLRVYRTFQVVSWGADLHLPIPSGPWISHSVGASPSGRLSAGPLGKPIKERYIENRKARWRRENPPVTDKPKRARSHRNKPRKNTKRTASEEEKTVGKAKEGTHVTDAAAYTTCRSFAYMGKAGCFSAAFSRSSPASSALPVSVCVAAPDGLLDSPGLSFAWAPAGESIAGLGAGALAASAVACSAGAWGSSSSSLSERTA
mmetsp:Transcript_23381/g.72409  ORF Transcript_23381/g.72409 Transcript_23381/m.72409 type:complete len:320 (-) Transcript_23381:39-998(-)